MKRSLSFLVILLFILTGILSSTINLLTAQTEQGITLELLIGQKNMMVGDALKEIDPGRDTVPVIVSQRTLLPIRAVIESIGGTTDWDPTDRSVTITVSDITVKVWMKNPQYVEDYVFMGASMPYEIKGFYEGSKMMEVNGEIKMNDVPPIIMYDRMLLPLRFISENVGCIVNWDDSRKAVTVIYGQQGTVTQPPIPSVTVPVTTMPSTTLPVTIAPTTPSVPTPTEPVNMGYVPPKNSREKYNFNIDWKFIKEDVPGAEDPLYDDSSWETVTTPHTFNDVDSFDDYIIDKFKESPVGENGGENELWMGVVWYRKHFKLDESLATKKVFVEFEGARHAAFVYINGQKVGQYEHGVNPFGFDISPFVKFGPTEDNVLAVKVDNREEYTEESTGSLYQWNRRRFNPIFGGLNRDVNLYVTDMLYQTLPIHSTLGTTGTYIYPSDINIDGKVATINVETQVANEYRNTKNVDLEVVVVDAEGEVVNTFAGTTTEISFGETIVMKASNIMENVNFWSIDSPYLYKVYTILKVGGTVVDANVIKTGFRKAEFRAGPDGGLYLNNEYVYLSGYAQRATNEWPGVGQAKPRWLNDFDGKLLKENKANHIRWMHVAAAPVEIEMSDKYGIAVVQPAADHEGHVQGRQWEHRTEVMRDTIIYYRNNPSILFWEAGNNDIDASKMREMKVIKDDLDPYGMRALGCRSIKTGEAQYAEYASTMKGGTYSDALRDMVPVFEAEYMRDECPRRVWDDFSPPDFDYIKDPNTDYDYTSESFVTEGVRTFYKYYNARTNEGEGKYSGAAALIWADSNQHGRQVNTEVCRTSGKVDAMRIPKEIYYAYRVMQSQTPDIHVVGHWTYPEDTTKDIHVIAKNVAEVELFVNDASIGKSAEPLNGFEYVFPGVAFQPGKIKAVGYDSSGTPVCESEKETVSDPAKIKLTVHSAEGGLVADGQDVVLIDVEVVDAQGRRCPTDQARVDFALTGPAEMIGGYNSGKPDSVFKPYLDTECGINRIFVRSTREAGKISVVATRRGLESGTCEFESKPIDVKDGLVKMW